MFPPFVGQRSFCCGRRRKGVEFVSLFTSISCIGKTRQGSGQQLTAAVSVAAKINAAQRSPVAPTSHRKRGIDQRMTTFCRGGAVPTERPECLPICIRGDQTRGEASVCAPRPAWTPYPMSIRERRRWGSRKGGLVALAFAMSKRKLTAPSTRRPRRIAAMFRTCLVRDS